MKRWQTVATLAAAVAMGGLSGCGGSTAEPDAAGSEPDSVASEPGVDSTVPASDDDVTPAEAFARVTIGDEVYEATDVLTCSSGFSGLKGLFASDDGAVEFEFDIPPENWETSGDDGWRPPKVVVIDQRADRIQWLSGAAQYIAGSANADPDFAGVAVVESFAVDADAGSVSGTATFVDGQALVNARGADEPLPEAVNGSFEAGC